MENLTTISLNFSDGGTVVVSVKDNPPEILAACIRSASEGKPIYYLSSGWAGYMIQCKKPDRKLNVYISGYRCGEYSWTQDATYAKHFSRATAEKHILELYRQLEESPERPTWGVIVRNSGAWGMSTWCKHNDKPELYDTEAEAQAAAKRYNDAQGPVNCFNYYYAQRYSDE